MRVAKVPENTINRLSIYSRYLRYLAKRGESFITSEELGQKMHFKSAQVRRDFAYFGHFGFRGKGYRVKRLSKELEKILGLNRRWPVAIVGAGNLGRALSAYPGFRQHGFEISAIFDNSLAKIGKTWQGVEILDIKQMPKIVKERKIKLQLSLYLIFPPDRLLES